LYYPYHDIIIEIKRLLTLLYSTAHAKPTMSAATPRTDSSVYEFSPRPQRVLTRHDAEALGENSRSDAAAVSASASIRGVTPRLYMR